MLSSSSFLRMLVGDYQADNELNKKKSFAKQIKLLHEIKEVKSV